MLMCQMLMCQMVMCQMMMHLSALTMAMDGGLPAGLSGVDRYS